MWKKSFVDNYIESCIKDFKEKSKLPSGSDEGFKHVMGQISKQLKEQFFNTLDRQGATPLSRAASNGDQKLVIILLDNGADVNGKEGGGGTALHSAAAFGHKDIVELLIAKGADVNAKGWEDNTAFHFATMHGYKDIVELLIAKGADVNAINAKLKRTPLEEALSRSDDETYNVDGIIQAAQVLVNNGAKYTNKIDGVGGTDFHMAAMYGNIKLVTFFIDKLGVDVNAKDANGSTVLSWVAGGHHKGMVEFLLAKGADANLADKGGRTPLMIAEENGNKDIISLIKADITSLIKAAMEKPATDVSSPSSVGPDRKILGV